MYSAKLPLISIIKRFKFLIFLLKPELYLKLFRDPARARFSLRKPHGHSPCPSTCLKIYPQPPAQTLPRNTLKTPATTRQPLLASHNSPATTRQPQLAERPLRGLRLPRPSSILLKLLKLTVPATPRTRTPGTRSRNKTPKNKTPSNNA